MRGFHFRGYRPSVNAEATRALYGARPLPWAACGCAGCRNWVRAVKTLPPAVTDFFTALGLDPEKPAEVCVDHAARSPAVCAGSG